MISTFDLLGRRMRVSALSGSRCSSHTAPQRPQRHTSMAGVSRCCTSVEPQNEHVAQPEDENPAGITEALHSRSHRDTGGGGARSARRASCGVGGEWSSLKSARARMTHGLAERFGAVVMRLRDREIGVHVAALVIDEVRVLPRSAVALHPKARVANDDLVDCGADRHWFIGGWRIGQR